MDLKDYTENYKIGRPIFIELFNLSDVRLKEKLNSIFENKYQDLLSDCRSRRVIENEEPDFIELYYYEKIRISPMGIYHKPEHGREEQIISFNKHFKL